MQFSQVIYAGFTQARIEGRWLAIQSNVALAIVGVIIVTFCSISGLGFSTLLGINFNAATTQVKKRSNIIFPMLKV